MRTSLFYTLALSLALIGCADSDLDDDGVKNDEDCEPLDATALPGGVEVCDGVDNDCDGEIDEEAGDLATFYLDADGDRYGTDADTVQACAAPERYVAAAGDCDDADAAVNEGMLEICNEKDDNCDGSTDEGSAAPATWYRDADEDRFGSETDTVDACDAPTGYIAAAGDCDDADAFVHPGALERCDGVDEDCNGEVDDSAIDKLTWFGDLDGDGFGTGDSTTSCLAPDESWVLQDGDCDDGDSATYPGAEEVCDEVDNDCDTHVDEGATDASTWYRDADSDSYGTADVSTLACDMPDGFVSDATDCDDVDATSYPGGTEVCDGADNDCNGTDDDGAVDVLTWYADSDGDGAGDPDTSVEACEAPSGYVANDLDCDDTDGDIYDGCFPEDGVLLENCGQTGRTGPSASQCSTDYAGTDWETWVSVSSGKQTFTIPTGGTFTLTARGAAGDSPTSSYDGGRGAEISGEFKFSAGDTIEVVVGQMGQATGTNGNGGGGGGTFVIYKGSPILVAGGGGGTRAAASRDGCDASISSYGTTGSGSSGSGSGACVTKTSSLGAGGVVSSVSYGSGGGGYTGSGANDGSWGTGGQAYTSGALGGDYTTSCSGSGQSGRGGFGGGGSGAGCWGGGGGGGYSGGDGGFIAGGGGSYNTGSSKVATSGVETGHGSLLIERL